MSEQREVPGPAQENNERILERGYESDFARLPDEEVDAIPRPGGGPHGGIDAGPQRLPLVVVAVGVVLAILGFGLPSGVALAAGIGLVVAGGVWAGGNTRRGGLERGPGTSAVDTEA
ncbi:MAG TPA: hypothetical protein VM324_13690 [Egibacteraceae bacterium]|nr:hypothetical protein [Egibacteraceae bacterium]